MIFTRESICLYTSPYPGMKSMEEVIEYAAELGVGGVEFRSFCPELKTADRAAALRLGKLARVHGLRIPCFSVATDFLSDVDAVERLQAYAEICSDLEIPYLHHTLAYDQHATGLSPAQCEERFQACIEPALSVCSYAERLGVRTLLEDQGYVFNGIEACERMCALSGDRMGIVADFGNTFFVDERPEDFIRAMGPRIAHVHVKDFSLFGAEDGVYKYRSRGGVGISEVEIGTGAVDLGACLRALRDVSYDGMISLEFASGVTEGEADRVMERLVTFGTEICNETK